MRKLLTFEDFSQSIEDEDFLDNGQKGKSGNPNSYKDLESIRLKNAGKLKSSKKRRINVLPQADTLGIGTKDASMIIPKGTSHS